MKVLLDGTNTFDLFVVDLRTTFPQEISDAQIGARCEESQRDNFPTHRRKNAGKEIRECFRDRMLPFQYAIDKDSVEHVLRSITDGHPTSTVLKTDATATREHVQVGQHGRTCVIQCVDEICKETINREFFPAERAYPLNYYMADHSKTTDLGTSI